MPLNLQYDSSSFIVLTKLIVNTWVIYLNIRQLSLMGSMVTVPDYLRDFYPPEHLTLAKQYQYEKILLTLIFRCYDTFVFIAEVYGGVIPILWRAAESIGTSDEGKASTYIALSTSFETLIYLPLRLFNVFVIEQRYGFNRQDVESFLGDTVKEVIAKSVLSLPLVWITIAIMKWKPDTYQNYLMVFTFICRVVIIVVYLEFLFPLLATFTPLPEGPLKNRIKDLASTVNFPLYDIYVMQASQHTTHGNAFFIGLGSKKMIVFFDTMLEGYVEGNLRKKKRYSEDELLGILAHEMGHWHHQHITKALLVFQVVTCIELWLCSSLARSRNMYQSVGFTSSNIPPNYIGFLVISPMFLGPLEATVHYITRWMSRQFELEADQYSASLGQTDGLMSGLKKISSESLKLPASDSLYSAWYDTHPTLDVRIKHLMIEE